ncbi:hypothetical protein [Ktedonobacter racemifer]|uniref:Uncharacterized protein n=1 Tax=Ktedonobacter racemifer DSM 44963 TaxID=485913 RepID=D6TDI1_KTERA|nr:hypothetical protein [Ktedonobacter racemifer]EFH88326.1 hypothetical protein Krac_9759 [Ktedonobacter racemifer DSM 44963]
MHRISTENVVCDQGWMQQGNCGTDLILTAFHGALRQHKSESTPLRFAVNDAFPKKGKRHQECLEAAESTVPIVIGDTSCTTGWNSTARAVLDVSGV